MCIYNINIFNEQSVSKLENHSKIINNNISGYNISKLDAF